MASTFLNGYALPSVMDNIRLNTTFVVVLVVTLILFTIYYIIFSIETEERDYGGLKEITGKVQSFEVPHGEIGFDEPTKKVSERYDDKLFDYLEQIRDRRDETFFR